MSCDACHFEVTGIVHVSSFNGTSKIPAEIQGRQVRVYRLDYVSAQDIQMAIKPMLYGAWPKDATRARKWWYRCTETTHDVDLAWRFTLSRKGVVAGIPPSWLDLVDKAIEAAKTYRPATEAELGELKKMAVNCPSLFEADDKKYADGGAHQAHDDGSEYYA